MKSCTSPHRWFHFSVAIVCKHPGRVANRTKLCHPGELWQRWKISAHWYTNILLRESWVATSFKMVFFFHCVGGKKTQRKNQTKQNNSPPASNYNPQTLDHWQEKLCCRCWKEVMGKSWLLWLMANVKERTKNVQRGTKELSDKQKGFPAQQANTRKVFRKDRGRSRLKAIWDQDCS